MGKRGGGGEGVRERMDQPQLIQVFSDQTEVADAHILVLVVELTPFLSHLCHFCTVLFNYFLCSIIKVSFT